MFIAFEVRLHLHTSSKTNLGPTVFQKDSMYIHLTLKQMARIMNFD
jgi:hypothetical protein